MTIQELYEQVDGSYEQAVRVMKLDKLIDRYVRRFDESNQMPQLLKAVEDMDADAIFERAHALKGICGNLGFDRLAFALSEFTEEFRPGNARCRSDEEIRGKMKEIKSLYQKTVDGIRAYEAEN